MSPCFNIGHLLAMTSAILFLGCGGETADTLGTKAAKHIAANEPKSAIITLKSALQANERSPKLRYLLGKALLLSGEPVAADVELRKAQELGHSKAEVMPLAATALLQLRQFERVVEMFGEENLDDPQAQSDLRTSVATALASLGRRDEAMAAVRSALAASPAHINAQLLQSRLLVAGGDTKSAVALLEAIVAIKSDTFEAYQLLGDIRTYLFRDAPAGTAAYKRSLELQPAHLPSHTGMLVNMFSVNDIKGAQTQLEAMTRVLPKHPQTLLFKAMLDFRKGDQTAAKESLQLLLRFAPENAKVLQLAGANEYYMGGLRQAEAHLVKAVQIDPTLSYARSLLALTQLRQGQPGKAVEVLRPVLDAPDADLGILFAAGEAYLQLGDPARAETLFSRAAKGNPEDPQSRTALAVLELTRGKTELAFAQLQAIAQNDKGIYADMALISARMRGNDAAGALTAIAQLERKQPDRPSASFLRARVLLGTGDTSGARQAFMQASKVDPMYFPAVAGMAALDAAEGKLSDAQKRFEDLLKRDPKQTAAMLALASVRSRAGAPSDEVIGLLQGAAKSSPANAAPRLAMFEHYVAKREWAKALTSAREGLATLPESPELVAAAARAHLALGEHQQAVSALKKLVGLQPSSAEPHLLLADAYVAMKDNASAMLSLRRAIELAPGLLTAHRGLITLTLATGKTDEALVLARSIRHRWPKEAVGYLFEGDIQSLRKNRDAALRSYRDGLAAAPTSELAVKVHFSLAVLGQASEADKFAASWMEKNPRDATFRFRLAEVAMTKGDNASAEAQLQAIVEIQPESWPAWNNLAWVLLKQKKAGALAAGQKALALAPKSAEVMDTVAAALADGNKLTEALTMQKRVVEMAPAAPMYRLRLAQLLAKSGERTAARAELEKLAYLGAAFGAQLEVAELLRSLQ